MATVLQGPAEAVLQQAGVVGWEGGVPVGVLAGRAEQQAAVDQEVVVQGAAGAAGGEAEAEAVVAEEGEEEAVAEGVAEEILGLYTCFRIMVVYFERVWKSLLVNFILDTMN